MIDRRLHVLRVLRDRGTVTASAEVLHLTPSAVSQQLRSLARDLRVDLLQPHGRGVRLTPAAELLLVHVDELFAREELARADLASHQAGAQGRVRVCGFPSAVAALLAPVAAELHDGSSGIDVEVSEAQPGESLARLSAGDVDLAVLEARPEGPPVHDRRFEQRTLLDDPQDLLVPSGHALASRRRVRLAEAAQEDWVAGPSDYHRIVVATCNAVGFSPQVRHRAHDWWAYASLVGAGLGVALVPGLAVVPVGAVVRIPLADRPVPTRRVTTCVRRGAETHPTVRRVREALEAHAAGRATAGAERGR